VTSWDDVLYDSDLEWLMEETVDGVDVVAAEVRKVKENVKLVNDTFKHFRTKGFLQIILALLLTTT